MVWTDAFISSFTREDTVNALTACQQFADAIAGNQQRLAFAQNKLNGIEKAYKRKTRLPILVLGLVVFSVLCYLLNLIFKNEMISAFVSLVLAGVFYLVARFKLFKMREEKLAPEKQKEIDVCRETIRSAQDMLTAISSSEELSNLLRFLPEQYFEQETIRYLLGLFRTRRANTLAEALNAYEMEAHNRRMEAMEMQKVQAAQVSAAANVSAANAQWKQADILKQHAKDMKQGMRNLTAEQSRTTAAMQDLAHEQHQTTRAINRAANETRRVGDLFNNFLNNR